MMSDSVHVRFLFHFPILSFLFILFISVRDLEVWSDPFACLVFCFWQPMFLSHCFYPIIIIFLLYRIEMSEFGDGKFQFCFWTLAFSIFLFLCGMTVFPSSIPYAVWLQWNYVVLYGYFYCLCHAMLCCSRESMLRMACGFRETVLCYVVSAVVSGVFCCVLWVRKENLSEVWWRPGGVWEGR